MFLHKLIQCEKYKDHNTTCTKNENKIFVKINTNVQVQGTQ